VSAQAPADIPVRQLLVDMSAGFPRHWHGGDAYASHLMNSFSMMLPLGEQYVIEMARRCQPMLQAAGQLALLQDVQSFIGQEAAHRRLHADYNRVLADQGYSTAIERLMQAQLSVFRKRSLVTQLAVGAAIEHWTSLMGDYQLRNSAWAARMAEPLRTVWSWHAAEESEHKAVLFDLYRQLCCRRPRGSVRGYLRRCAVFVGISLVLLFDLAWSQAGMLSHDGLIWHRRSSASALRLWCGRGGLGRHLLPRLLAYFRPGFHPLQQDNRALIEIWRRDYAAIYRIRSMPAAGSALEST
jgi:predicted metal-dependent hydrolase